MDHPYYTVTVSSLTHGWTYSYTEGEESDAGDPVHMIAPFRYTWEYADEVLPGHMDPGTAYLNFAAHTARDIPAVDLGDLITIEVRIGTTGPRIIAPPPMSVAVVDLQIDQESTSKYPVRMSIGLTDLLIALRGTFPEPGLIPQGGSTYPAIALMWRPRLAQLAARIGRTIGAPTWWADKENPLYPTTAGGADFDNITGLQSDPATWSKDAHELLRNLLNSHQPNGLTHTIVPGYSTDPAVFPTGWRRVGPDSWWGDTGFAHPEYAIPEPLTSLRYYAVPASRRVTVADSGLPLKLAVKDGRLTVEPVFSNPESNPVIAVDAAWCDLPIKARRGREHMINTVRVHGSELHADPGGTPSRRNASRTFIDQENVAAHGPVARNVDTALDFGDGPHSDTGGVTPVRSREDPLVGAAFLEGSLDAWAYDAFNIVSSRIPQDIANVLLPKLAPRFPGEPDGDEQVLRHLTIGRIKLAARPTDQSGNARGFINFGQLTIDGGDMLWTLGLSPGDPDWVGGTPTPVTFAEFEAKVAGLTYGDIDPNITFADLEYVDS